VSRACALALAVCLAVPAAASAKGGVIFDRYPDVQKVGSAMKFTVMTFRNREGVRPLVTFRNSKTGQVVRVRTGPTDLNGIAYGSVRLPSTGPWQTAVQGADPHDSEPFRVGVGLTQTIPSADAERARAAQTGSPADASGDGSAGSLPWIALALAASAAGAFALHRRRRWGAA
jgi:MYXO-CTERM domain-containing protein